MFPSPLRLCVFAFARFTPSLNPFEALVSWCLGGKISVVCRANGACDAMCYNVQRLRLSAWATKLFL
jgi:hypothetical protein